MAACESMLSVRSTPFAYCENSHSDCHWPDLSSKPGTTGKGRKSRLPLRELRMQQPCTSQPCPDDSDKAVSRPKAVIMALDCEFVECIVNERVVERAATVSLVGQDGSPVYESYIRVPHHQVQDYRTSISGVTAQDLRGAPHIRKVREHLQRILADNNVTLIGHTIFKDLKVLGVSHPRGLVVDLADAPCFQRQGGGRRRLRDLAEEFLGKEIQRAGEPHSAREDAAVCVELYKISSARTQHNQSTQLA